jgi:hypothetical protein
MTHYRAKDARFKDMGTSMVSIAKIDDVSMSPRSRLYGLVPCGLGTVWTESLTSYLNRLACCEQLADVFQLSLCR